MLVLRTAGVPSAAQLPYAGLHQLLRPVLRQAVALPAPQREALLAAFGMTDADAPDRFLIALASLELLGEAAGDAPAQVELHPLPAEAAGALLDELSPGLAPEVRERLLRDAAGNPLALVELPLVRADLAAGALLSPWLPLTARLVQAFAARVTELPAMTRTLLLVAALEAEGVLLPFGAAFLLAVVQMARGVAALGAGRHGEARRIVSELELAVSRTPAPWVHVALRHARALVARDGEADARFEEALGADLSRWPYDRARLQLAYGAWLRRQRRVAESRAPLRAARDAFDALGAIPWGERARRELRASGESSRRRTPEARDELTPQELQIAQMAAAGMSNREIGARLYLSHRTVGSHLYRIFPKLGITSRGELRRALAIAA